eukprot:277946_1
MHRRKIRHDHLDQKTIEKDAAPTPIEERVLATLGEPEEVSHHDGIAEEYLASESSTSAAEEGLFGKMSLKTLDDEEFSGKAAHAVDLTEEFCKMGPDKSARKRKEKKEVKTLDLNFRVASTNAGGSRGGDDRGDRGDKRGRGRGRGRG